jgi:L-cystine transport system permease protein
VHAIYKLKGREESTMNFDFRFIVTAFFEILTALPLTLLISIVPLIIGFGIAVGVSLIRLYKVKVIHKIADFYVSFIRGTPMLLHIMIIYFALPQLFDSAADKYGWSIHSKSIPVVVFVLVAFSITAGAYMSEIIRSGILSVDRGQTEAAYAIGMSKLQMLKRIVFPQAFRVSLPNLCNLFIGFLHGSSLAFTVSVMEINGKANVIASTNWKFLESFIAAALIYWSLTWLSERITSVLEKRFNLYNRGGVI